MSTKIETPKLGTPEWDLWLAGAAAEHEEQYEGMNLKAKEVYETAQIIAQQGYSAERMIWFLAVVFTCEWSLRDRLKLAWRIVRTNVRARSWKVYLEPRDWWIGYYRGDDHHYVCVLPCVVIRWNRRAR